MISFQAKLEFLENLSEHLACHWDGKMIEDLLGILNEAEAIVASGRNGKYKEGKLLDIVDLIDKDGKKNFIFFLACGHHVKAFVSTVKAVNYH